MITLEDIQGRIERPLTTDEVRTIPQWIADAETVLAGAVPDLEERMKFDPAAPRYLSEATVKLVLTRMVERKVRNPQGLRSFDVDGYQQTIDRDLSAGKIYLSADDLAALAPRSIGSVQAGAYSIGLSL